MESKLTDARIRIIFIVAFIVISVFLLFTFTNMRRAETTSGNVKSSLDLLLRLESSIIDINAMEASQNGFLIAADEKLLLPFYESLNKIRRDTTFLAELPLVDTRTINYRNSLLQMLHQKIGHAKQTVEIRKLYGADSASKHMVLGRGKEQFENIVTYIDEIKSYKRSSFEESNAGLKNYARRISWEFFALVLLFFGILYYSFRTINSEFKKWEENDHALRFNASVVQNMSDPIITIDENFLITNWNKPAEELYGYTEEEAKGKKVGDLLHTVYPAPYLSIENEFHEKNSWKGEVIHYHKNGTPLFVEITTSGIRSENGENLGIVEVVRDVTERKKLQQELQHLNQNLEQQVNAKAAELTAVFERITDAFIALDNNWNYTYVNKMAARLHGRQESELLGKNIWEQYPHLLQEPFHDALQLAKDTQQPQRLQLYYKLEDKWYEDLIYPTADGISVYYHDITEKRKAELALEKVHEKLSYHINNSPMGVIEFDSDFNLLQWNKNAEHIFGWSAEEVLNGKLKLDELMFEEDRPAVHRSIVELVENNTKNDLVTRNLTKKGKVIYSEWYNSVLKDEQGKVTGVMSLVLDITQRKKIEIELQEAEAKFRNLVEQSLVGVYIIQDEKLVYVNPRFAEIFGYNQADNLVDFKPEDVVHPDDLPIVMERFISPGTVYTESINFEFRATHKDGHTLYLEVFGSVTIYRGEPALIGTLIDITERKKSLAQLEESEKALKISNERFMLVAQATNDAVWDWDFASGNIWGNDRFREIFNLQEGQPFGFDEYIQYVHPDDREQIIENFREALHKHDNQINEEFRLRTSQNDYYLTLYDRSNILYNSEGQGYRMLGAMQDITELRKSARQLVLEKELSDSIINSLPGIFYLMNRQGELYRWNKNLEAVTGYGRDELLKGNAVDFFYHPGEAKVRIEKVFNTGEDSVEAHLITKNGEAIPYYFTGIATQYEGEHCLIGVGIDISERVHSQRELKKSEENFRMLIEQASDGIFICNQYLQYLDVNSSAAKLTGYSKEELLDMNMFDNILTVDPNSSEVLIMDDMKDGNVVIKERTLRRKNGQVINVEISAKMLPDGRFQGIVRDITARKIAAEALRLSENKYRLLFNQNPMPMWMLSMPDNSFLDVNPAAISFYGYSKEEFLRMHENDLFLTMGQYHINGNGKDDTGIWDHKKKDGSVVKVNIIAHDIHYEGRPAKLVLANDVTDKIAAEENLKKSHEELRQLATHLENIREAERTHMAREIHDELGQQLTGLKMDISWINRKIKSADEGVLQKIQDTIKLIDKTVITVRRIATQLRPSILDDLGLIAAMEWQSDEFEKRSEIQTFFTSNVTSVQLKPEIATAVFRVFQESLTNVLRHAAADMVEARLEVNENSLELTIKDNGRGFNPADIENKKTLGLLGMKERVLLMGGTYQITSEQQKGTLVRIIVPLGVQPYASV